MTRILEFRTTTEKYPDLYTPPVVAALEALAPSIATGARSWRRASPAARSASSTAGA